MNNTVFWSWNDKLKIDELERQIRFMSEQGIDGFFIHARDGLGTAYMSDEWFECIEASIAAAGKYGVEVWLYDEEGWPSGSAGGAVERLGAEYRAKRLCASEKFDESFRDRIIGGYKRVNDKEFVYTDDNDADLWIYYDFVCNVDRMYSDSGKAFIRFTHEVYKKRLGAFFGNEIKGIFFDEPGNSYFWPDSDALPWSVSLAEGFKKYFGYDPIPELWRLFFEDDACLFRSRFVKTQGYLFRDNFLLPIAEWCDQNGLALTGHFCMEEAMHTSLRMSGSVMNLYRETAIPGIDLLGRRTPSPVLTRQISSIANQFGKKKVMCEVFGASGYDMTFTELLSTWRKLAVRGVNMPCLHLFAYSVRGDRKFDFPGFFSPQSSWFGKMRAFTDELSFINGFVSSGEERNSALIVDPLYSLSGYRVESVEARKISSSFRQLLEEADAVQLDYDVGDEDILARFGSVENGKVKVGNREYKLVIVPECDSISASTLRLLEKFEACGGDVLFIGGYPRFTDFEPDAALDEFIAKFQLKPCGNVTFAKRIPLFKALGAVSYERKVEFSAAGGELVSSASLRLAESDGKKFLTVVAPSDSPLCGTISVRGAQSVYGIGPTGKVAADYTVSPDGIFFSCSVPSGGAAYYVLGDGFAENRSISCLTRLLPDKVTPVGKNVAVLDKLGLYVCGKLVAEGFAERLTLPSGKGIRADYIFDCTEGDLDLTLYLEDEDVAGIEVNGRKASRNGETDAVGRSGYDLSGSLKVGKNVVAVTYGDVHSGRRAEAIILKGDFTVKTNGLCEYPLFFTARGFSLVKRCGEYSPREDLVRQGLCFYAGGVKWSFEAESSGGRVLIGFVEAEAVAADVMINGEYAFTAADLSARYPAELKEGKNRIDVVMYTSDAGIYGPFHHRAGYLKMVSPSTFRDEWGSGDNVLYPEIHFGETFDKRYHFKKIRFGAIEIAK